MSASSSGQEVFFDAGDIIVSKTDLRGRITYANKVFCDVAGYSLPELIGQPHSIIRHADMPRCVFKLLWEYLQRGEEIFAYVKNATRNGGYYWVLAHVTPSYDAAGAIIGYHSNRRVPKRETIHTIIAPLYRDLLAEEEKNRNGKEAVAQGYAALTSFVQSKNIPYDELIFSI